MSTNTRGTRLSDDVILSYLEKLEKQNVVRPEDKNTIHPRVFIEGNSPILSHVQKLKQKATKLKDLPVIYTDVFIAGSGPIGATYASVIIESHPTAKVYMAEIGSQDSQVIGEHHKNSIKYQKDIDAFVSVIKGALQPISIPTSDTFMSTLGGSGWTPGVNQILVSEGHNPNQNAQTNLKAAAVTRTVGGMATHWTCNCPVPDAEERRNNPLNGPDPKELFDSELDSLLDEAKTRLNVHNDQYDQSIRHTVVKDTLEKTYPTRGVTSMPLGVQRNSDNPDYVTWTGMNTVLGKTVENSRFTLSTETRVTKLIPSKNNPSTVAAVKIRDLRTNCDSCVVAKCFVIACGAIGTPQVLSNSGINPPSLGRYLAEQSLAFCQIVLKRSIVDAIWKDFRFKKQVRRHHERHPKDILPIPFRDPEPQVMIPYKPDFPWHIQIHRDAFSYGDVGPKADPRVVVDLRCFGKQDVVETNRVRFSGEWGPMGDWVAGVTDIYGMPQATFEVVRSVDDAERDQRMMRDMTDIANSLGSFLPGSAPQFMEPGLALHITGTTRIGTDSKTSVADPNSKVHTFQNLWVGGNGCIPDSTASNPTRTSVAIAIKGARDVVKTLEEITTQPIS